MKLIALAAPLLLAGCSLVEGVTGGPALPYELRCHDDIDAATCRARAAELAATIGGPDAVIESVDIAREGYGICWDVPGGRGCLDGLYPDAG